MIEHMIMAGFIVWLIAAALYILDTALNVIHKIGDKT